MTTFAASVTIVDLPVGTTVTGAELFEAVQTSNGVGQSVQLSLNQLMTFGGMPTGGATGTILNKSSGANFSTQFSNITQFVAVGTSLATTGSATSIVVGVVNNSITSTQIANNAVGTNQIASSLGIASTLSVGTNFTVGGTSNITGTETVTGTATFNGGMVGNGTLGITGNSVLTGTLGVVGNSVLTGTLGVIGTATFTSGAFNVIATTINVTGTSLITGTFGVVGTAQYTGVFNVAGTTNITGFLTNVGSATFTGGTFNVMATTNLTGIVNVVGTSTITGVVNIIGTTTVTGAYNVNGTAIFTSGTFGVIGTSQFTSGAFNVVGTTIFTSGTFGVIGTSQFTSGAFNVVGTTLFTSGAFGVIGTALVTGQVGIVGTTIVTGSFVLGNLGSGFLQASTTGVIGTVAAVGNFVLLNTLTPNGVASAVDTTSLTSTYKNYMFTFENVVPATTAFFQIQIATSGTNWISANYATYLQYNTNNASPVDTSTTGIILCGTRATTQMQTALAYGLSGFVKYFNPASSVSNKYMVGETVWITFGGLPSSTNGSTFIAVGTPGGYFAAATSPVTGVSFGFNTGSIATGTIKIYGMN